MSLRPNVLVPGVTKAGTTSLFWYLAQHPDICASDEKEIDYFTPLRYGHEPTRPLSVYDELFAHHNDEPYLLEASPRYFYGGPTLVARVHATLPDARLVFALRDPVDRMVSAFRYQRSRGLRPDAMTFDQFVDVCLRARASGEDRHEGRHLDRALAVGRYSDYLPDWYAAYDPSRITIVFFEHLVADPETQMRRLCTWLDLDAEPAGRFDYTVRNRTVATRSHRIRGMAETLNARIGKSLRRLPAAKRLARAAYERLNGRPADRVSANPSTRARLQAFYAPANAELARLVVARGVDLQQLPAWLDADRVRSGAG